MNRTASIFVGIAAAATLTLTGCSGSTTEEPATQPAQTQAAESSAPSTETSASAEASASSESSASASTESGDDSSDKPSKDDIVDGLVKFYVSNQGLTEDQAKKFAVCMVDEMYDKADAKTLSAMRDGDPTKINPDDANLFATAGVKCASALQ